MQIWLLALLTKRSLTENRSSALPFHVSPFFSRLFLDHLRRGRVVIYFNARLWAVIHSENLRTYSSSSRGPSIEIAQPIHPTFRDRVCRRIIARPFLLRVPAWWRTEENLNKRNCTGNPVKFRICFNLHPTIGWAITITYSTIIAQCTCSCAFPLSNIIN